jgi:AAA+ ATPase superfamily predicted ATPase
MTATPTTKQTVLDSLRESHREWPYSEAHDTVNGDPWPLAWDAAAFIEEWFAHPEHNDVEEAICYVELTPSKFGYDVADWHFKQPPESLLKAHLFRIVKGWGGETALHDYLDDNPELVAELGESLPSRFQRVWDLELKETGMTLILIGSSISVMEEKVLSGSAPLYGRRTATIDLHPLPIADARQFFPEYDATTTIMAWSVYGGTPYYLRVIDPDKQLRTNVQESILSERGLLYSEPEFLLRTELRQPNTYFSILRALAHGRRTPTEIGEMAGVESQSLSTYLQKLRRLRLVERHIPVTESPTSSKRGRYRIAAPLFRFWFRFVFGNQDQLRMLGEGVYAELVAPELPDYVSPLFERLCQRALPTLIDRQFRAVGQWWFKQHELDVLGLADEGLVAGECKFTTDPVSEATLADLERTAAEVRWPEQPSDGATQYVLFSRSGYTDGLKRAAGARDDVRLVSLGEVVDAA